MAQRVQELDLIDQLSYGRIALGAGLVVAPGLLGRTYLGREASRPLVAFLLRVFGVRDLVVGIMTMAAKGDKEAARKAVMAGIACDSVDAVAAFAARDGLPRWGRRLVLVAATGAAAMGVVALNQLES